MAHVQSLEPWSAHANSDNLSAGPLLPVQDKKGAKVEFVACPGLPYKTWSMPSSLDDLLQALDAHKVFILVSHTTLS
jgi:hypothetical protein